MGAGVKIIKFIVWFIDFILNKILIKIFVGPAILTIGLSMVRHLVVRLQEAILTAMNPLGDLLDLIKDLTKMEEGMDSVGKAMKKAKNAFKDL